MDMIRVLIVDDSTVLRNLLRDILQSDSQIKVVGEAKNGAEAVHLTKQLKPDLVTMDIEMPVMGGMEAIVEIMATHAVPILVVSSEASAEQACAAVVCGALEAVSKTQLNPDAHAVFLAKVKMLANVRVITHIRKRLSATADAGLINILPPVVPPSRRSMMPPSSEIPRIFAIASSTGGPQVLASILKQLPADFSCAVLISQHISDGFAPGMAVWLASVCKLPVHLAQDGEPLAPGTVYISPSEANMSVLPSRRISLLARQLEEIYHPTCDVLLASVANVYGRHAVGIILTGMGRDGVAGMEKIRQAGGVTVAQDEASSVVFGMNKIAIDRGSVQQVLSAEEIPHVICRLAATQLAGKVQ